MPLLISSAKERNEELRREKVIRDLLERIKKILQFKIFVGKQEVNILIGRLPDGVEKAEELLKEKYNLMRSDLQEAFGEICEITGRDVIRKITPYLPSKLIAAFSLAQRVVETEDKGEFEKNEKLFKLLVERFGSLGKKCYNLLRSGEFQENILPYLELLKSKYNDEKEIIEEFSSCVEEFLDFYPFAVWINITTDEIKAVKEIVNRLVISPQVKVYGRGEETIKKVRNVVEKVKELLNLKELTVHERIYTLGRTKAIDITIIIPSRYLRYLGE